MAMTDSIEVELISKDLDLIRQLAAAPAQGIVLGPPRRIPGFGETLGVVAITLGVASFPAGILASLFASWLWENIKGQKEVTIRARLQCGERSVELELTGTDDDAMAAAISGAIAHVAKQ